MNWGGSQASDYLLRLLQLKYPAFPVRLNASQSSSLLETPSLLYSHPQDYHSHIASLSDLKKLQAEGQTVQIPFVVPEGSKRNQISEEERLKREERKREAGKRLRDMTEKNRLQKLGEKEEQLRRIAELKDWKGKERKAEWQVSRRLGGNGPPKSQQTAQAHIVHHLPRPPAETPRKCRLQY
jgi:actin-related protein 5